MRIGLIADIHGNLTALDIVLSQLDAGQVDHVVCLGDLAVLGPQPNEVISRVRRRQIPTVCGNTDAWLVRDHPIPAKPPDSPETVALTEWAARQVDEVNRAFLAQLPLSCAMPLALGRDILCFHATPDSVDDIIAQRRPDGGGEQLRPVLAGGHTHIQEVRRLDDKIYINPGSVGLPGVGPDGPGIPVNRNVSWAEFAVIDDGMGRTDISLRRIPLDINQMWLEVQRSGMPHADWWRSRWAP